MVGKKYRVLQKKLMTTLLGLLFSFPTTKKAQANSETVLKNAKMISKQPLFFDESLF